MDQSFGKKEKLKSKTVIDQLFAEGSSLKKYPLRLVYIKLSEESGEVNKTCVSVPKRNFRHATDRNHLKRLMREAYRKNKYLVTSNLSSTFAFMFVYTGREKVSYEKVFFATEELLKNLVQKEK
ncbi:ribonuclease P protein component [Salinimicrobium soli]|uniref:ribonuclease P protein component n=1 Tax=Salinimicrobium soli TaxID=1254399 RepID=UPI003AAFB687